MLDCGCQVDTPCAVDGFCAPMSNMPIFMKVDQHLLAACSSCCSGYIYIWLFVYRIGSWWYIGSQAPRLVMIRAQFSVNDVNYDDLILI